jgi:hypothetical protein
VAIQVQRYGDGGTTGENKKIVQLKPNLLHKIRVEYFENYDTKSINNHEHNGIPNRTTKDQCKVPGPKVKFVDLSISRWKQPGIGAPALPLKATTAVAATATIFYFK